MFVSVKHKEKAKDGPEGPASAWCMCCEAGSAPSQKGTVLAEKSPWGHLDSFLLTFAVTSKKSPLVDKAAPWEMGTAQGRSECSGPGG